MPTITYTEELVTTSCWCGIHLAIPANLHRIMHDEGKGAHCPLGHTFVFGDTYKEKLRKAEEKLSAERRRVEATRDLLAQEERSHAATRGHVTRMKKREAAGVCPCCNRTFKQLSRHMTNKHPDYAVTE